MKKNEAISLYRTLSDAKVSGMSLEGKLSVFRTMRAIRPLNEAIDADIKEISDKIKPDNFEKAVKAQKEGEEWGIEVVSAYNEEFGKAVTALLSEEYEATIERVGKEDLGKLLEANDTMEASRLSLLYELIGKEE